MDLDGSLREFISPFDFIGLIRCIATFENIDRPEVIFDFEPDCLASIWDDKKEGIMVSGMLSKMFYYSPLYLLHIAAHEIGHLMSGHLHERFYHHLLAVFFEKRYYAREVEADKWAERYAFKHAWRTSYRDWNFMLECHSSKSFSNRQSSEFV